MSRGEQSLVSYVWWAVILMLAACLILWGVIIYETWLVNR